MSTGNDVRRQTKRARRKVQMAINGMWPGGVNETLYRLRRDAVAASHGETEPYVPSPREPSPAEQAYIDAAEAFRAGHQCAGWDHFERAEALIDGSAAAGRLLLVRVQGKQRAAGTVVAHLETTEDVESYADKDGCLPESLKVWRGVAEVGDTVELREPTSEETRQQFLALQRRDACPASVSKSVRYQLPDGRVVKIHRDVCRMASLVTFALESGEVVNALICAGEQ